MSAATTPPPPHAPLLSRCTTITRPWAILVIVIFANLLLLPYLASGDPNDMMELFNLVPVHEAYRDGHWFMPTLDGMPRFEKPPLAAWIPAAFATLFHSDSLWILRLPSLLLGIVTCLATYAMGCRLFGNPDEPRERTRLYALLAALFLPAIHLFNHESRLASYDIYATAFTTLCALAILCLVDGVAAARAAGTQLRAGAWWSWTLAAGIALGLSLLSKGPAPPATVLVPMIAWMLLFHRSRTILAALAMIVLIGLIVSVPWGLAIFFMYPDARALWTNEVIKLTTGRRGGATGQVDVALRDPWYYYFQILIWVAPLTPTFVGGLVMPFLKPLSSPLPSTREKQGRWLLWMIILGGLLILTLPSEKKLRYSLQLAPYICLLCAAVWQEFIRLDAKARVEPAAGILLWAQALFFIGPGIAGIIVAVWMRTIGYYKWWPNGKQVVIDSGWLPVLACLALTALGIWHLRQEYRRRFIAAAISLAACAAVLMLTIQLVMHTIPAANINPTRFAAEAAAAQVGNAPLYTLHEGRPWIHTLFFLNRPMHEISAAQLVEKAAANPSEPLYLVVVTANSGGKVNGTQPISAVASCLEQIQSKTGRTAQTRAEWLDEWRRTNLIYFPPAVPASKIAP